MRRIVCILIISILFSVGINCYAEDTTKINAGIYFDGSGSMKGFFDDNLKSILDVNAELHNVFSCLHIQPTSQVFVTNNNQTNIYQLSNFISTPSWGNQTFLDKALGKTIGKDIVVLVTDNVQDVGDASNSSIQKFYKMLDDSAIQTVFLCPLKYGFNGPLYFYRHRHPVLDDLLEKLKHNNPSADFLESGHNNDTYQVIMMDGEKSLAVYIILKTTLKPADIDTFIRQLSTTFNVEPLLVKPIDQGYVSMDGTNDKNEFESSLISFANSLKENGCKPITQTVSINTTNLLLSPKQKNMYRRTSNNMDKSRLMLVPEENYGETFYTDQQKQFRFYSKIINKSGIVHIGRDQNPCSDRISVQLKDITYTIPKKYQKCFHKPGNVKKDILPDYIPGGLSSYYKKNNMPFTFISDNSIEIPPFRPFLGTSKPFKSLQVLIKLAFTNKIPLFIYGKTIINIPPGEFSIDENYEEKYFTSNIFDQERIYTPVDIISYINKSETNIQFDFQSKEIYLKPPRWIKRVVFSAIFVVLLIIMLFMVSMTRRLYLIFDDHQEALSVYLPAPFTNGSYKRDENEILVIKKGFFSYYMDPGTAYYLDVRSKDGEYISASSVKLTSGKVFKISGPGMNEVMVEATESSGGRDYQSLLKRTNKKKKMKDSESSESEDFDDNNQDNGD